MHQPSRSSRDVQLLTMQSPAGNKRLLAPPLGYPYFECPAPAQQQEGWKRLKHQEHSAEPAGERLA